MILKVFEDKQTLGKMAALQAAAAIQRAIAQQGAARILAATGASQFEFLDALTQAPGLDWQKVEMFHLDEYVGLPADHPASFCRYLMERLIQKTGITRYHLRRPRPAYGTDQQCLPAAFGEGGCAGWHLRFSLNSLHGCKQYR